MQKQFQHCPHGYTEYPQSVQHRNQSQSRHPQVAHQLFLFTAVNGAQTPPNPKPEEHQPDIPIIQKKLTRLNPRLKIPGCPYSRILICSINLGYDKTILPNTSTPKGTALNIKRPSPTKPRSIFQPSLSKDVCVEDQHNATVWPTGPSFKHISDSLGTNIGSEQDMGVKTFGEQLVFHLGVSGSSQRFSCSHDRFQIGTISTPLGLAVDAKAARVRVRCMVA